MLFKLSILTPKFTSINWRSCFNCFSRAWTRWLRSSFWDLWCCSISRPCVSCSSRSLSRDLRRCMNVLWSFSACRCKSSLSWTKRSVSSSRAWNRKDGEGNLHTFRLKQASNLKRVKDTHDAYTFTTKNTFWAELEHWNIITLGTAFHNITLESTADKNHCYSSHSTHTLIFYMDRQTCTRI